MKFVVMGSGGVGGFFGGKLARGGQEVWFVARGEHLKAMQAAGLRIESSEGNYTIPPGRITGRTEDAGPADVILICVKSYDTESATRQLIPIVKHDTIVISLQNGVDNEEKMKKILPTGIVYGGVALIYATITTPGVVTETGGPKKLTFGPLSHPAGMDDERGKTVLNSMIGAGINAEYTLDIHSALWKKFIFITAVAGLTTITRLTLGEILSVSETRRLLVDAMREVELIAKAKGARIEPGFMDMIFQTLRNFENNTHSSLYYDLMHQKPMEIEALSGIVVRYGAELDIPTPINKTIYAALLPYHLKHSATGA